MTELAPGKYACVNKSHSLHTVIAKHNNYYYDAVSHLTPVTPINGKIGINYNWLTPLINIPSMGKYLYFCEYPFMQDRQEL